MIFTGGIGGKPFGVRARICADLQWAGLTLGEGQNQQTAGRKARISSDGSRLAAFVICTDEELVIARDTVRCVLGRRSPEAEWSAGDDDPQHAAGRRVFASR